MHFKTILIIILLSGALYAKPVIYLILSNNCPHCHNLMGDINNNTQLKEFLSNEYEVQVIDVTKTMVPAFLPFEGTVPTIVITDKNKLIGDPLQGEIPSIELMRYLIQVKNHLEIKNQEVYYVY